MKKLSAEQIKKADEILARLDKVASDIQSGHEAWGMSFDTAKAIVNHLDKVADDLEASFYGDESLLKRQAKVLKIAKVIQHDSDESYMATFNAPMAPKQVEADEPYMQAYGDDQSSAVANGKASNGRPLAP